MVRLLPSGPGDLQMSLRRVVIQMSTSLRLGNEDNFDIIVQVFAEILR